MKIWIFSITDEPEISNRDKRHAKAQIAKKCITTAVEQLSLNFSKKIEGHNENRFYSTEIEYPSVILKNKQKIKIEFGIQEKVWERKTLPAYTILIDSITHKPVFPEFNIKALSLKEAYSEKIRAAFSRKQPAIRDIFDIHYAIKNRWIEEPKGYIKIHEIAPMVKHKLKTLNRTIDLSDKRKEILLEQLQTDLKPVLRKETLKSLTLNRHGSG